jgi:5,6-dimethylbenzimidazole synthase
MPETTAYSAVCAVHAMWLYARTYGIGLGWVSVLDPAPLPAILDVPEDWRFIGYFCMGYPEAYQDVPELETVGWERRRPPAAARVPR